MIHVSHNSSAMINRIKPSNLSRRLLRASLLVGALAGVSAANAQAIFSATEQAWAGGAISVRGDALDPNTQFTVYPYSSTGTRLSGIAVSPTSTTGQVAMMSLPASLGASVYEISASTSKGTTNSVFVNRPRLQWVDVAEAMPGNTVRVIGRNLNPVASIAPTVTLTNNSTKAAFTATNVKVSDSCVSFAVPANAAAGTYSVSVNNNLAGAASAGSTSLSLGVVAAGADPFGLGTSWASGFAPIASNVYNVKTDPRLPFHAAGDGVTDDTNAVRWALTMASQDPRGGTVYLPAGTYHVDDGGGLFIYAHVVLSGDGKGKTVLQVGYRWTPSNPADPQFWPIRIWSGNMSLAGIANLTIENLNTSSVSSGVLGQGPYWLSTDSSFLKNVEVKINNGRYVTFAHPHRFLIADCSFTSTSPTDNAISITDARELQFLRNTVSYRVSRTTFDYGQRLVVEGNTITFDNNYRVPGSYETGGLQTSISQQVLVQDNTIGATGPLPTKPDGDGELIMTQLNNYDFSYVGMVKTASSRIVIPVDTWSTTQWQNGGDSVLGRCAVAIISGKGSGQWRWVTSWSKNAIMVDRPWQVVPDATSRYSIGSMSNFQQTYVNNQLFGSCQAFSIWDGAVDMAISHNTITNTGGILMRGDSVAAARINPGWAAAGSNMMFAVCWDSTVTSNSLVNSNGFRPAYISLIGMDEESKLYGTVIGGMDIRNNQIAGSYTSLPVWSCKADGIEINDNCHTSTDQITFLGTIVQNNSITAAALGPILIQNSSPNISALDNGTISATPIVAVGAKTK